MNANKIKEDILFEDVMKFFGFPVKKRNSGKLFYQSPFRNESDPSFVVVESKNLYYDFGEAKGGSTIDFVMAYKNFTFTEAIRFFNENFSNIISTNEKTITPKVKKIDDNKKENEKKEEKIILEKVVDLTSQSLLNYISVRNIDLDIAKKYLKQVHYSIGEKKYFGVGFGNDTGGYEVRNNYFKGCIGHKDITLINQGNQNKNLFVFEGFFDFLSYIQINKSFGNESNASYLILNSTSFVMPLENLEKLDEDSISKKLAGIILEYDTIDLFLDNDATGIKAKNIIMKLHPKVNDNSYTYENHNDLNDFLREELSKNKIIKR